MKGRCRADRGIKMHLHCQVEELEKRELLEEKNTGEGDKVDNKWETIGVSGHSYGPWHIPVLSCFLTRQISALQGHRFS
jgi:hypothetical protein